MTSATNADKKIAPVVLLQGRRKSDEKNAPKNKAIPPPRGSGTLCKIAGCFLFGSSIKPYFFVKNITTGVIITVIIKEKNNGVNTRFNNLVSITNCYYTQSPVAS